MRGVLSHAGYIPYRRLDRSTIAAVAGTGGGPGTRSVASYDEDTTTMAVEAARLALRGAGVSPALLTFSTTQPAYLDKTNATAIHAALRLPPDVVAVDAGGAVRSAVGSLRSALLATEPVLVVAADIRTGLPGSADEAGGGDGASAILIGSDADGPLSAELVGWGSATEEFLDRWRTPGDVRSKVWEERFGEGRYADLAEQAWTAALKRAGIVPDAVDQMVVSGAHTRLVAATAKRLGVAAGPDLTTTVGFTGAAHPGLLLSAALEAAEPGRTIALVSLADGADVLIVRTTPAIGDLRPVRPLAGSSPGAVSYGKFLAWRGMLPVEPPRRPEPARVSAPAAARHTEWKFGLGPLADLKGTVVALTVDRLAYSPSPPIVFAVVDFDGEGRSPLELTDVDPDEVKVGDRVEMTFRRLSTADGIHNYFWKARPLR